MKVEIEIPEWASESHIYVLAGAEPFVILKRKPIKDGIQEEGWDLWVKIIRCNLCGKCCIDPLADDPNWIFGERQIEIDGGLQPVCGKLDKQADGYHCMAGPLAPWGCIAKNPPYKPHPDCIVEYTRIG